MTKVFFKLALIGLTIIGQSTRAQQFYGQAVYESKTKMPPITGEGMSPEMTKQIEEMMKKQMEKTFTLTFNQTESSYEQQQKLETPQPQTTGINIKMVNTSDGKRYTNIRDKKTISEQEIFGKEFLVTDELPKWEWQIGSETKKIGDYDCIKATAVIKVSDEQRAEYEKRRSEMPESQKNKRIIMLDEPQDYTVTAWFTTEIPVGHGPAEFWGLPGLILEVNDGRMALLCSKIVLNPKEKPAISVPKTGEKVTQKEFDAINEKKIKQRMETPEGRGQDGQMRIRIGG